MKNEGKHEMDISSRGKKTEKTGSFGTIFMHSDAADKWLMIVGFLSTTGGGLAAPTMLLITSKLMNTLGNGPPSTSQFTQRVNKVMLFCCDFMFLCAYVVHLLALTW